MPRATKKKRSNKGRPPRGSKKGLQCETPYCRNLKARKSNGYYLRLCWKCRSRNLKKKHPATYVYNALKQRAKARRIPWSITLEEFKKWAVESGYLEKRGHGKGLATVDRINANDGYHLHNIQVLEFMENCTKGHYVPGLEHLKQNSSMPEELKTPPADNEQGDETYCAPEEEPF